MFLCLTSEVPLNGSKRVSRGRLGPVAVFHVDGEFYVIDDRCTHGAASLSKGEIVGRQIVCPLHFGSFDLTSGEPIAPPCDKPIRTYRPIIEGEGLYIDER